MTSAITQEWRSAFSKAIADVGDGMNYMEAAQRLRGVISTGLLSLTDIREHPEKFFMAHRLLAEHATRLGPGFFIRFTVHFNLFGGTVVALGTDEQLKNLVERNKQRPRLGCFGLTECLAGVNSGLVVETTAEFVNGEFVINTPNPGAAKNWISQGLVADEAVVVAMLTVNGKNYGAQAFLVEMRDSATGKLKDGITAEDMGRKTVGNDLDNARLSFKNVKVPREALLARYLSVAADGTVSQPGGSKLRTMDMIGQRLFTGRVGVAQAAIEFSKSLFSKVYGFASKKVCWAPGSKRPVLAEVPQIADIFATAQVRLQSLSTYMSNVEAALCQCLRKDAIPPLALQQAIAVGKVKCIEVSIELCFALKQEVGSYALMAGTGFEQMDFLQCCKFAEGDSRILMQKMARDLFRVGHSSKPAEAAALEKLKASVDAALKQNGGDKAK
ncbi:hypothetical protein HDU76_004919, partial [Blyttiomyces sp. JEL0837]